MDLENSVVYVSPNRAHHFQIARELKASGLLHSFYCGASRLVSRNRAPDLASHLVRVDGVQSLFVILRNITRNSKIVDLLALRARKNLDHAAFQSLRSARILLGYSGAITYCLKNKPRDKVGIVEAVNTHVDNYDCVLESEASALGLHYTKTIDTERERRLSEYALADAITIPSEVALDTYKARPEIKAALYLHWIRPTIGKSNVAPKQRKRALRVLFVGQVSLRKGIRYLVECARAMSSEAEFRIVGQISEPSGLGQTAPPSNVTFTGSLAGAQLQKEYLEADLFVLPSLEEGMALVMFEAMNAGLPVIATTESGFADLCGFGARGCLISSRSSDAIETAIRSYLIDGAKFIVDGKINRNLAQRLALEPPKGRSISEIVVRAYKEKMCA